MNKWVDVKFLLLLFPVIFLIFFPYSYECICDGYYYDHYYFYYDGIYYYYPYDHFYFECW